MSTSPPNPPIADPDMDHIRSSDYANVYEPSEDTFLLMSAFDDNRADLTTLQPQLCLEIGCGTGIVISHLSNLLKSTGNQYCSFFATDVNPDAARIASMTLRKNAVRGGVVLTSFASSLEARLLNRVDILIFNPPYVPSPASELGRTDIIAALSGGLQGRQVLDKFLPLVKNLLSSRGMFFLVVIEKNNPEQIIEWMRDQGFACKLEKSRTVCGERLRILRFFRAVI